MITIEKIEEVNNLEVLEVRRNTVVVESSDNNDSGTFSWLSMTGSAVYVVNLDMAEYLIDQRRSSVTIRVPKPVFEYRQIDKIVNLATHTEKKLKNGSIAEGEEIAQKLIKEGNETIRAELQADQESPQKAQEAAVKMITSLVRQTNPEVHDLHVNVEFME